jgi:segregation and condensation protein B
MRLVRDDDVELMEQQDELQQADSAAADPAPAADDEQRIPNPTEQPDGPIADSAIEDAADEKDDSSDAADVQVDLRTLEALLFSTHHPLTAGRLAELLDLESTKPIRRAIRELNEQYVAGERSFRVEQVAGGYQMLTLPEFGEILKTLHQREVDAKLTKAALETLAIIAYKQPILRADIEAIRGVACGETIRSLMEKHLVKISGRAEIPGRPILYGTTKRFLELFGLNSLKDLPQGEDQLRPTA